MFASRKQTTQYVSICFSHISSLGMVVWSFDMLWDIFRGISLSHVGNSKSPWLVPQAMLSYLSKPNAELKRELGCLTMDTARLEHLEQEATNRPQRGRKGWLRTEKEMAINKTKRPGSICSTTQRNPPSIDLVRNWLTRVTLEWMFQAVGLCTAVFVVFPHIFVWGSCFWFCIPPPPPLLRLLLRLLRPPPPLPHTPSFTHNSFFTLSFTHHLCHTLSFTPSFTHQLCHTPSFTHQLCHPPSFTHQLCHTTISHTPTHTTIFHIQLCLTPSLSHTIFHTPTLSQSLSHNYLSHTTLSHTIFHIQLCLTQSFTYNYLSHTILSHTIFHTQFCRTPSFTHNFVTHYLSHTTLSHNYLSYTTLSHTIFHIQPSFTHNLSHTIFHAQLF